MNWEQREKLRFENWAAMLARTGRTPAQAVERVREMFDDYYADQLERNIVKYLGEEAMSPKFPEQEADAFKNQGRSHIGKEDVHGRAKGKLRLKVLVAAAFGFSAAAFTDNLGLCLLLILLYTVNDILTALMLLDE